MAEKQPKKAPEWLTNALGNAIVRLVLVAVAALGVGGSGGWAMAGDGDTAARVDSLEVRMDTLETRQTRMEQRQMDMFTAQVESDTALRAVLERRAEDKEKAAAERKAAEKLINLGGTP